MATTHVEEYTKARGALSRAHANLEKIADQLKAKIQTVNERADLSTDMKARLVAAVRQEAQREFDAARNEVERTLEAARSAVRKGRRADSWDTSTELRVAGATNRIRHFLEDPDASLHEVVKQLTNEAVADGDLATVLALRRELPALARRRGLPSKAIEPLVERLDVLTGDQDIELSVAHGRELPKLERNVTTLLNSFREEVEGRSPANIYPDADGKLQTRNGYRVEDDGTVKAPEPATAAQEDAAARLEREYKEMFG